MNLIDKLPHFYDNIYCRPIIDAEQVEADILLEEISDTLKQCFVDTATWGLDYWEDMLFLPRGKGKTYEERRSNIYAKMIGTRTTTVEVVRQIASLFFGAENVIVTEHNSDYFFNIDFENVFSKFLNDFDNNYKVGTAKVGFARIVYIRNENIKLQSLIDVLEIYKPAHLNYNFTFSSKNKIVINSTKKYGYSYLPICNVTYVGTWWEMCTDGVSNKGKVIQAKSYDGYSYLPICGIYKCKIKGGEYIDTNAVVGHAVVGHAVVGGDLI